MSAPPPSRRRTSRASSCSPFGATRRPPGAPRGGSGAAARLRRAAYTAAEGEEFLPHVAQTAEEAVKAAERELGRWGGLQAAQCRLARVVAERRRLEELLARRQAEREEQETEAFLRSCGVDPRRAARAARVTPSRPALPPRPEGRGKSAKRPAATAPRKGLELGGLKAAWGAK